MSQRDYAYCPFCAVPLEPRVIVRQTRPGCPRCGFVHFRDPKVAVVAQVEQNGRVLLVRRAVEPARGLWAMPGGYMDAGEMPESALRRELREEVGLDIDVQDLLAIFPIVSVGGVSNGIVLAYRARPADSYHTALHAQDDVDAADWFAPDALPADLAFTSTQQLLADWRRRQKDKTGADGSRPRQEENPQNE